MQASSLEYKSQELISTLGDMGSVAIAFSGGVDSSLLLAMAIRVEDLDVVAVTGVSPSLSAFQLEQAKRVAENLGADHRLLTTKELEDERYTSNPANRCFFCKDELFKRIQSYLGSTWPNLVDGNNLDDCGDFRPGREAGRLAGVRSPLVEAQMTKSDVRELSRRLNLETADYPASPCLASRIKTGVPVTALSLARVEQAESAIRDLGLTEFRVRDLGGQARLEVAATEQALIDDEKGRERVRRLLVSCGFEDGFLDPRPLRSGRLNETDEV